jgi:hypothetical protein
MCLEERGPFLEPLPVSSYCSNAAMNHGCSALGRLPAEKDDSNGGLVCVSRRRVRIMAFGFRFTRRTAISDQTMHASFSSYKKYFFSVRQIFFQFFSVSQIFFSTVCCQIFKVGSERIQIDEINLR